MSVPCPNCGRLNRPGARYCASCQTLLEEVVTRMQPGQVLGGGAYRIVRPLGRGGMGAVWLVAQTKAFDRLAVLKEVVEYFDSTNPVERQKAAERFEAEARTLGELKHPGIPDLYAYFSESGHNYLVMEYIEGLDLRKCLTREDETSGQLVPGERLSADQVLRYTIQICEVLDYLSRRQPPVIHNDIKPGNIIVDEHSGRAVLVDFGTAKTRYLRAAGRPDQKRDSIYGTVGYAAPELYQGHSEPRSDVYSLAATAYHLLTDDDPRDHPSQYPQLDTLPPDLADILRAALAPEVTNRATADKFRQRLEGYLGGLSGPLRALTFPDGEAADEREELLALAVKHWHYAAGLLHDGTIASWLRHSLHDPVAAQAAEMTVKQWPNSPDAALDAFVRQLSPTALPPAVMELRTASIRLLEVGPDQQIPQKIEIANRGQGYLQGEAFSTQSWVKVSRAFACPPGGVCAVPVEIDSTGLVAGQSHVAAVTLTPVGGSPEVVAVQITVAADRSAPVRIALDAPAIEVTPSRVDFGTVSRGGRNTTVTQVTVTNTSKTMAQCRVQGIPRWLEVKPATFRLVPGARQVVRLGVNPDKASSGSQKLTLTFAVDAGPDQQIEILLRVRGRGLFG